MANYTIIGGDKKEYGPITADSIRQWITEGRLNGQSLAKLEGDGEWRPLLAFQEFADLLAAKSPPPFAASPATGAFVPSAGWLERDYELDIGGCVSRGFNLFKENLGPLLVAVLIYWLVEGAIAGLGAIPFVGSIFTIANMVIIGPLMGGLFYVFIQIVRGQKAEAGDVFIGFQKAFARLFLGHLVPGLLAGLCLIPCVIVAAILLLPLFLNGHAGTNPFTGIAPVTIAIVVAAFLVCLVPMIFLSVCWCFTLPLIIDRQMDFWPAMQASWKMVRKHWWQVFGLMVVISLLNVAGFLCCCVGMLFTMPVGFAAMIYAYETIFADAPAA
jgi:uncharacterized membrane protein